MTKKFALLSLTLPLVLGALAWLNATPRAPRNAGGVGRPSVPKEAASPADAEKKAAGAKTGVGAPDGELKRVAFVDGKNGWGITIHGLWKSEDGGRSWAPQRGAAPAGLHGVRKVLDDVQFTSRSVGWLLEQGQLMRTRDGGDSWQPSTPAEVILSSCRFINDEGGWCVGRRLHSDTPEEGLKWQGAVYATRDGGDTWEPQFATQPGDSYSGFESVYPLSAREVWALGPTIMRTADGGRTWQEVRIGLRRRLYGRAIRIEFADERTGWITTSQGGAYLLTNDGGKTWELRSGPHREGFYDLIYTSASEAYAAGGGVYKSSDGGKTWAKIIEGDNASYMDLSYLASDKLLIAAGSKFSVYPLN